MLWTLKALDKKGNPFEKNRKGKQWKRERGKKNELFDPTETWKAKKNWFWSLLNIEQSSSSCNQVQTSNQAQQLT